VVLPKSGLGRPRLRRLLLRTLAAANLGQLQVVSHRLCRSPAHLGLDMDVDLVQLD